MFRTIRPVCVAGLLAVAALTAIDTPQAEAANRGRQYYGGWTYNPIQRYLHRTYYYLPAATATTYSYHYVVYYPTRPRYYYYYNPVSRQYWGRFDLEEKGYSMFAEKDRKEKLDDIPEKAFPKAGKMPAIPDTTDEDVAIEAPPLDAPKEEPKDEKKK